ncbi:MAG TPA: AI-2E family transporter [Terriglobales bacterium]|nr:AI-2E family transporter [Terriglobales bacterium]
METSEARIGHHWSLTLLGIGLIVMFAYYGESVLAVLFFAILLSFVLSPVVQALEYVHVPRALAALISMVALLAVVYGVTSASYNQAVIFADNVPKYSQKIRSILQPFRQEAEKFEKTGEAVSAPEPSNVVRVRQVTNWSDVFTRGAGTLTDILLAALFVPFLAYFLLTWRSHARSATVMLFPLEHRNTAYVTLGLIGKMLQSFIVGNLLIGLLISGVSVAVFWLLHVPFFYFVGFLSGFLSLVPYLGIVLAMVPPILVGLGQLEAGDLAIVVLCVVGLHLFALNVLYPKLLGSRLKINPLAVTIALMFWGAIWGAIGLVLAIPITAAIKIVFDHVESMKPYADWLGE